MLRKATRPISSASASTSTSTGRKASKQRTEVVVAVGTDHHPFDRLVAWADEWAAAHPDVSIIVQRGTSADTTVCESVEVLNYDDLCERFAMATVVVSHGGPSTVMDARMGGSRPIVVARNPEFGEHVDGHQMRFAEHLTRHDLAEVVAERDDFFAAMDDALQNPERFKVPVEATDIVGVVEFGRVLDGLLGTSTHLMAVTPSDLSGQHPATAGAGRRNNKTKTRDSYPTTKSHEESKK